LIDKLDDTLEIAGFDIAEIRSEMLNKTTNIDLINPD
jgi:hypothetical protein